MSTWGQRRYCHRASTTPRAGTRAAASVQVVILIDLAIADNTTVIFVRYLSNDAEMGPGHPLIGGGIIGNRASADGAAGAHTHLIPPHSIPHTT